MYFPARTRCLWINSDLFSFRFALELPHRSLQVTTYAAGEVAAAQALRDIVGKKTSDATPPEAVEMLSKVIDAAAPYHNLAPEVCMPSLPISRRKLLDHPEWEMWREWGRVGNEIRASEADLAVSCLFAWLGVRRELLPLVCCCLLVVTGRGRKLFLTDTGSCRSPTLCRCVSVVSSGLKPSPALKLQWTRLELGLRKRREVVRIPETRPCGPSELSASRTPSRLPRRPL